MPFFWLKKIRETRQKPVPNEYKEAVIFVDLPEIEVEVPVVQKDVPVIEEFAEETVETVEILE